MATWAAIASGKLCAHTPAEGITLQIIWGMMVNRWVYRVVVNLLYEREIDRVLGMVAHVKRCFYGVPLATPSVACRYASECG